MQRCNLVLLTTPSFEADSEALLPRLHLSSNKSITWYAMASSSSHWPENSALILCDYQNFILESNAGGEDAAKAAAERAVPVVASARKAKIPIIFVVVLFRPGAPEVSDSNKAFSAYKAAGAIVNLEEVSAASREICTRHKTFFPSRGRMGLPFMRL